MFLVCENYNYETASKSSKRVKLKNNEKSELISAESRGVEKEKYISVSPVANFRLKVIQEVLEDNERKHKRFTESVQRLKSDFF